MKILMTGETGMVGSRVAHYLSATRHEVTALRRYTSHQPMGPTLYKVAQYDLRGGGRIPEDDYDVVLHLGAMASNTAANAAPVEAFDIIATGTMRLLEAIDRMGIDPVFVLASSSEVYATEGHRGAVNPYAAAKIAAEEAVTSSRFNSIVTRPFNTYGRALIGSPVAVIDKWIVQSLTGVGLTLGSDEHLDGIVRDFLWREDHVSGYLDLVDMLANREANPIVVYGERVVVEFGTGEGVSLRQVLDIILEKLPGTVITRKDFERTNDVPVLLSNPTNWLVGWEPKADLEQGIERAIAEWRAAEWRKRV